MTNPKRTTLLVAFCLALLMPMTASAQDAEHYLSKMLEIYNEPFKADYTMTMEMNQGGMAMSMEGSGDMTYSDATHMMLNVDMSMKMPGSDQGMNMKMKTIADGTNTWTEMDNPMMGKQVMKMDIAKAQAMAEEQGMSSNPGQSPLEQIKQLQEYFDFKVAGKSDGKVRLEGVVKADAPAQIQEAGPMAEGLVIMLDEKTSMLDAFEMGPVGAPVMVMSMSNYKKLSASDVPASMFTYEPPAGVTVIDPLAMQQ